MEPMYLDFGPRIRELTANFSGREWLLGQVDQFIGQDLQRYLVITGEPGIGKSAFAAHFTQVRRVHAHHFCSVREGGTLDPVAFVRSLSEQLAHSLPDFSAHVLQQEQLTSLKADVHVGEQKGGQVYGIYIENYIARSRHADEIFQYLVREPLLSWAADRSVEERVVLLVDGLDEGARLSRHPNIPDLIDAARDLPPCVRWLLTSRTGEHLATLPGSKVLILDDAAENMEDIREYIPIVLREPVFQNAGIDLQVLGRELESRSEGNFLYLRYVLKGLREDLGKGMAIAPERLPVGLDGVYVEFLGRILQQAKDEWRRLFRPILGVLAVAQEGFDFDTLVALSGVDPQDANDAVVVLSPYMDVGRSLSSEQEAGTAEAEPNYRLYHASFDDFLTDRKRNPNYWINPSVYHRQITDHYLGVYKSSWQDCDLYGLRHIPTHLVAVENRNALVELLTDFGFLEAKIDRVSVHALIADYDLAQGDPDLTSVQDALHLSAYILAEDKAQLRTQLSGRLLGIESPRIHMLLDQIQDAPGAPWLSLVTASLPQAGGALIRTLTGHTGAVNALALAKNGRWVLSGGDDGTIRFWDVDRGVEIRPPAYGDLPVQAITVTPDGRRAITATNERYRSSTNTLTLWDLESGDKLLRLDMNSGTIRTLAVKLDGKRVLFPAYHAPLNGWVLRSWDMQGSETEVLTQGCHPGGLDSILLVQDGKHVITGGEDYQIKLWDLESGEELHTWRGHKYWVFGLAVTPKDRQVVSGAADGTIGVWDFRRRKKLRIFQGHLEHVNAVAAAPDGNRFISASRDSTLKVWDLESGAEIYQLSGHVDSVNAVVFLPDGNRCVSASSDRTLKVWDLTRGGTLPVPRGHEKRVYALVVTPDGRRVISASRDETLKVWDLESGAELHTLRGHQHHVMSVAVTQDSRQAVSASRDRTLKIWDLESGEEVRTLSGHTDAVNGVAILPDGRRCLSASTDQTLKIWDMETGVELSTLSGHTYLVTRVAVTPDGRRAVSGSWDTSLKVWDLESGAVLHTLLGHQAEVPSVALTPDGLRALSASEDATLKVWDIDTGLELASLRGHTEAVWYVAVTPDGRYAISVSSDLTLKVWDLTDFRLVTNFRGEDALLACTVTPDGKTIIAGDQSGRLHFLHLQGVQREDNLQ